MSGGVVLLVLGLLVCVDMGHTVEVFDSPMPSHMLMPVSLGSKPVREKRGAGGLDMNQPFRILPMYSDSFTSSLGSKATLVQNQIIPDLLDFLQQSLSVAPLSGPILLNNNCTTNSIIRVPTTGDIICGQRCAPTYCGSFLVPNEHLKQCMECNTDSTRVNLNECEVGSPAEDGVGVSDYDFVLYITAEQALCPAGSGGSQTVAFASSCQTEQVQDRPVAGTINFCPEGVANREESFAFAVSKHEILHALGFSSFLFALWRDPATNEPRTQRDAGGLPEVSGGVFQVSSSTIDTVTYDDWYTVNGHIQHQVSRLVTPAIQAEARSYFDCPTLAGVELENQGGPGTAGQHWEKRVLGNEAMTGILTFNPVFSRFTFALLEDSGWYRVNYSLADDFVWGKGAGCRFAEGSCGEWITNNDSPAPFCDTPESTTPLRRSCTADREAVSRCNLVDFTSNVPLEYRFFESADQGGRITLADFCPFQDVFNFRASDDSVRGTTCSVGANQPSVNSLLESYGTGSRCVTHRQQWTVNGQAVAEFGGGCYQYSCSDDEVTITVAQQPLTCSCSEAGEERTFDMQVSGARYQGSIVCPPCEAICHASSKGIVLGENIVEPGGAPPAHSHAPYLLLLVVALLVLF